MGPPNIPIVAAPLLERCPLPDGLSTWMIWNSFASSGGCVLTKNVGDGDGGAGVMAIMPVIEVGTPFASVGSLLGSC